MTRRTSRAGHLARFVGVAQVAAAVLTSSLALAQGGLRPTGVIVPYTPATTTPAPPLEPAPPCEEDCFLLQKLVLRGQVDGTLSFELTGEVRAKEEQKIPLFGPPGQVRVDDVTIDGARASVGMAGESYVLFTSKRSFTARGKLTLGRDWMLSVPGPLLGLDASLSKGRLVEGDHLSGLSGTVLHFDPMIEGQEVRVEKPKPVFRLARTLRFTAEPSFSYKLEVREPDDVGRVELPLTYGEKVTNVEGAVAHRVEGNRLVMDVTGSAAELVVTGTLSKVPATAQMNLAPDERSAYEWWLVESDPEHRVSVAGAKLVDVAQTHLVPQLPSARAYLVQRGEHVELEARSLVRGDVLAAVARENRRFVAITGNGEVVSDEMISLDNRGLETLTFTPAGKAVFVSDDLIARRVLHAEAGARDVLLPVRTGTHVLRVQSLASTGLTPLAGVLSVPTSTYPLTTSRTEITVGLPSHVVPLAVLGGDRVLYALSRVDVVATLIGIGLALFGFRTRRTRILGGVVVAGLWFVSREVFVVASGGLFVAGAVFVASRFVRGVPLFGASAAAFVVALLVGRTALSWTPDEPEDVMTVRSPEVPSPEPSVQSHTPDGNLELGTGTTPVSISLPTSQTYVRTSRQLATHERPLAPRVVYLTRTTVAFLHVAWAALLGVLLAAHRAGLLALKEKIRARLTRRPGATTPPLDLDAPLPDATSAL